MFLRISFALAVVFALSLLGSGSFTSPANAQRSADPSVPITTNKARPRAAPRQRRRLVRPRPVRPVQRLTSPARRNRNQVKQRQRPRRATAPTTQTAITNPNPNNLPDVETLNVTPPYDIELVRLSEILGAVHYLRGLCETEDKKVWRTQMVKILDAESENKAWRGRLVQSFNRGYRGYARSHRNCTPSAIVASNRYITEGVDLTKKIQIKYSN